MSSRALRKLRGGNDLNHIKEILKAGEIAEEEESDDAVSQQKTLNVFDLLKVSDSNSDDECIAVPPKLVPTNIVQNQKRKKKKKNKNNKLHAQEPTDVDDIDQIISELKYNDNDVPNSMASTSNQSSNTNSGTNSTLAVRRKNLNKETELRRMFGSEIIEPRSRNQQFRKRTYIFATPQNTWPPMTKCGVQMVVDKTVDGITYFKYSHSKTSYQSLQQMFWKASHLADPHAVKRVLEIHPYHIDTLLHLSEVCRVSEDTQTASDLLERALFCLEKAFHPSFNVASLSCRMDYNRAENRALFVAIFRQIIFVSMKSCWQTAFELTKLLFNLSPEQDPMACLLFIDTFALKVEDYNFVLEFIDEFDHSKKLTMLPNIAYSIALANFYKEIVQKMHHQKSDDLLRTAILKYPMIAQLICEKCSHVVESNALFVTNEAVIQAHTRSLTQQCRLYVERAIDLWKDGEIILWFKRNVEYVNNQHKNMPEYQDSVNIRKNVFLSPPLNVMRHIFMTDISSVSALLPTSAFDQPHDPHDPMPPPNSYADYQAETTRSYSGNPVMAFLNSLMPGYTAQNPHELEDQMEHLRGIELGGLLHPAGDANQAGGWGEQFRNIPGDFGVALREMLANIYVQNNPNPLPEVVDEAESDEEFPEHDLD